MSIFATTFSIALTFGSAAWKDKCDQEKHSRQTAMMVLSDIELFYQRMSRLETHIKECDSIVKKISNMSEDSIKQLPIDEASMLLNAIGENTTKLINDKTTEKIFSSSINTWQDVENQTFINNVGMTYSLINQMDKIYQKMTERNIDFLKYVMTEAPWDDQKSSGQNLLVLLNTKEAKQHFFYLNIFVNDYQSSMIALKNMKEENLKIIGISEKEVQEYIAETKKLTKQYNKKIEDAISK